MRVIGTPTSFLGHPRLKYQFGDQLTEDFFEVFLDLVKQMQGCHVISHSPILPLHSLLKFLPFDTVCLSWNLQATFLPFFGKKYILNQKIHVLLSNSRSLSCNNSLMQLIMALQATDFVIWWENAIQQNYFPNIKHKKVNYVQREHRKVTSSHNVQSIIINIQQSNYFYVRKIVFSAQPKKSQKVYKIMLYFTLHLEKSYGMLIFNTKEQMLLLI